MSRPRHWKSHPSHSTKSQANPLPPISILMLRDATDEQFAAFITSLLDRIGSADAIGRLLVEMLALATERLRHAARLEPENELPGTDWCRYQALAERNARAAAKDLARHLDQQDRPAPAPARSSKAKSTAVKPAPEPEPEPIPESTPEEIAEAATNWQRHIALVRSISDEWPIILRLRREVEDVAAWLGDGKSEEELMRWYPGLTRADIAACRACDAAGLCGPFDTADGPYPPELPVLDDLPDSPDP
jgi:uncharacterized protein (DUF433 family)